MPLAARSNSLCLQDLGLTLCVFKTWDFYHPTKASGLPMRSLDSLTKVPRRWPSHRVHGRFGSFTLDRTAAWPAEMNRGGRGRTATSRPGNVGVSPLAPTRRAGPGLLNTWGRRRPSLPDPSSGPERWCSHRVERCWRDGRGVASAQAAGQAGGQSGRLIGRSAIPPWSPGAPVMFVRDRSRRVSQLRSRSFPLQARSPVGPLGRSGSRPSSPGRAPDGGHPGGRAICCRRRRLREERPGRPEGPDPRGSASGS